ncbi:MAG: 50S ribosomal protein L4 [Bacteroidales bacterium]|nr:50S ribosomal protein L4 [Bacteroidales bacterium]
MEVKILNIQGQETGRTIELMDSVFNIEPNDHAIYLDVKQHRANVRQGTHKAKERAEIAGSTRKLRKQKGGGGARIGSIKSPLLRGGGRVFGPRPRSYSHKLNKKVKQLARRSAFTYKLQKNELMVVEDFNFEVPRTKEILLVKNNLKINDKKVMFVFNNKNNNVYLSSRNLKDTSVITVNELNTYSILNNQNLVLSESTVATINSLLG